MDSRRSQFDLGRMDAYIYPRAAMYSCFRIRNTFCRTRRLSNATFSFFDHVMIIGWFFTEIWRYIDFQNGGRPQCWNCFTTTRDHPRSLCCWQRLPVKFHVNLTHRSEVTTEGGIEMRLLLLLLLYSCLNFSHIWLEMPIQVPKIKVLGDFGL